MDEGEERRDHPRAEASTEVGYQRLDSPDRALRGVLKNVSLSGAFVEAEHLPVGCPVLLLLEGARSVGLKGEVMRVQAHYKKHQGVYKALQSGFAVRFTGNTQRKLTRFSAWMARLLEHEDDDEPSARSST